MKRTNQMNAVELFHENDAINQYIMNIHHKIGGYHCLLINKASGELIYGERRNLEDESNEWIVVMSHLIDDIDLLFHRLQELEIARIVDMTRKALIINNELKRIV